jgi:23S rRNA (guanosine2251-2'-O)-methyltransferase
VKSFRRRYRPKKNTLIVGRSEVKEAIKSGQALDRIYLQNNAPGKLIEEISSLALQYHIPVNKVPVEKLNRFNISNHEGVVAQLARVHYYELQEIISFVVDKGDAPLFLILDGITDIRNIGAIARTAYCCGVHALVIPDKGVGALSEDAVLTSAGALEKVAVCRVNSLIKAADELHLNGIKVFASEMKATKNVFDCKFIEPCAIVMGSEDKGIYPGLMKVCDEKFKIPMSGDFESLNVSVAAGMILYEVMRQRIKMG